MDQLKPIQITSGIAFCDRVLARKGRIPDDDVEAPHAEDFWKLDFPMKGRDALSTERSRDALDFIVGIKICNLLDGSLEKRAFSEPLFLPRLRFRCREKRCD